MADASSPEDIVGCESSTQLLDFSSLKFKSGEEFRNALSKIPDLRMRPEKVRDSEATQNWPTKKKNKSSDFPFPNPIPTSLRGIRMEELSEVDIDWKMLTLVRPKTKLEEDVFTKIVEMERKKLKTMASEAGVIDNLRKKLAHISIGGRDEKGNQETYLYQTYAREKSDDALEEDKSADYIQRVAEMLSTSKLEGDYTKEIVKKKIKSRNRDEKWRAKVQKEKEKNRKKSQTKRSTVSAGVTTMTDDGQCPNENLQDANEKTLSSSVPASSTRPKNKFKKRTRKRQEHEVVVP